MNFLVKVVPFSLLALSACTAGAFSTDNPSNPRALFTDPINPVCVLFCRSAIEIIDAQGNMGVVTTGSQDLSGSLDLKKGSNANGN